MSNLMMVCSALTLVGSIWFLVTAFQKSIWWGLGCLFFPVVDLVFLLVHWKVAWRPFILRWLGFALWVVVVRG